MERCSKCGQEVAVNSNLRGVSTRAGVLRTQVETVLHNVIGGVPKCAGVFMDKCNQHTRVKLHVLEYIPTGEEVRSIQTALRTLTSKVCTVRIQPVGWGTSTAASKRYHALAVTIPN